MTKRRTRVAYFTPLQPIESGISQYSEDLVPWLATALDLDVIVDGYVPTLAAALRPARIVPARRFDRGRYDAVILNMGNSPAHNYMVPHALAKPNVLVLHDVVLHHLMVWRAVQGRGGRETYRRVMRARYGAPGEAVAAQVLRGQNPPAMFDFPLNEDLIRAAHCVVTHSPSAAAWVERLVPEAGAHVVPMGVPPVDRVDRSAARAALGIAPGTFVILSLGRVNPFKRMPEVFRTVRRLVDEVPDTLLLMVGGDSPNYDVPRLARFAGVERQVRRLGYVPDADLPALFAAADVCVNLRYPTAGETSAAVLRLMSARLPTVVTDTGAFADLPDDAVLKVPANAYEGETLVAFLRALATDASLRAAIGTNAHTFVTREHTMRRAAEGYLDVLSDLTGRALPHDLLQAPPTSGHAAEARGALCDAATAPATRATEPRASDPLTEPIAEAIADLGLTTDERLLAETASGLAALGVGVPKRQTHRLRR